MKLLLAVDGSTCSNAAVEEVGRRPWPEGAEVRIVSAFEPPPTLAMSEAWAPPKGYYEQMEKMGHDRAHQAVDDAVARLREAQGERLRITTETIRGLPKEAILSEAERWGAELIVVGSHGYGGWKRFWLGSVSHAIATHAKCSIEIVRTEQPREDS